MKIGFIGLGRMGGNMVYKLLEKKHSLVVYNRSFEKTKPYIKKGAYAAHSLEELTKKLPKQKIIWLMIKSGKPIDDQIKKLLQHLKRGDIIIDGGNSYFKDSIRRYKFLKKKGIHFVDVGTSGGIEGARHGACMMIGGDKKIFKKLEKLFQDLCVKNGYGYMGTNGAGHFVKMVHNGIEYGMMASIAQGLNSIRMHEKTFKTNQKEVAKVYSNGSIIEGRLMSWTQKGMNRSYFNKISGTVPKGETEIEMENLVKLGDFPMLKEALKSRKKTRKKASYEGKLTSVMRNEFGGHKFNKK